MNKLPPENIYAHTKKLKYFIKIINERLKLKKKISVLDFGCGNGRAVSQYIAGANICYYGVDLHKESVKYARNCFGRKDIYFDFDFAALPCQKFDVIIYSDILEHLEDPSLILKNHYSLLSDDGVIIGSVPNGRSPFEIEKKIDVCLGITKTIEEHV